MYKCVVSMRMASSGMLCRVALITTDVSEELSASFIRVTRIGELGKTLAATSNRASVVLGSRILVTLMKEALSSSETSVLTRTARRHVPEDTILHSHRRENLKSYTCCICPARDISMSLACQCVGQRRYRRASVVPHPSASTLRDNKIVSLI
jgi:hypothetical protein